MKVALQLAWDPAHLDGFIATARAADEAGVHSLWVNEGFGHDAFSGLTILARETRRVVLGTSIVNVYSRTPGALAQHYATIDQLSGGRVIAGLGASAQGVIERFHGQQFSAPRQRLAETAELLRAYWRKERFGHHGAVFQIDRALELGAKPVQPTLPIFMATMAPASVRLTAEVADGWIPTWIPSHRIAGEIRQLRSWAQAAGRDPSSIAVRSPGATVVVADEAALVSERRRRAEAMAFFVARNGEFYYRQFVRQGLEIEAKAIRAAWATGGPAAAVAAIPEGVADGFDFVGELSACVNHLRKQKSMGVDISLVSAPGAHGLEQSRILRTLSEA